MNELDGRRFVGLMKREGYEETSSPETADLVLLNTCSVRDKAEQKVYDRLGQLAVMKRTRPEMVLGVCGCVAQQESDALLARLPYVDFVLGTGRIEALPSVVKRVREEDDRPSEVGFDLDEVAYTPSAIARTIPHKASITVIEGCNKRCTFCVVPTTRGKERSRRLADVVEESRRLIEEGVVEIELLGQTVNAFIDPETGQDFADLIRAVGTLDGLRRLRFVTSHPRNFADRLISAMAETKTICPSLHLPVQSGSDKVLYRMKRQYTRAEYVDLAGRIRRAIPDIALSTDIIVGFPGETDEDFEQTLEIVRELEFASAFCFVYSPRPHTAAVRWENDVPRPVSSERLTRLLDLQQEIQKKLHANLEGKVVEVLVDGDDRKGKKSSGRSRCNRVVNLDVPRRFRPGTFVDVEVSRGLPNSLLAVPVSA